MRFMVQSGSVLSNETEEESFSASALDEAEARARRALGIGEGDAARSHAARDAVGATTPEAFAPTSIEIHQTRHERGQDRGSAATGQGAALRGWRPVAPQVKAGTHQQARRARFVRDGEVPVQTINRVRRDPVPDERSASNEPNLAAVNLLEQARSEIDRLLRALKEAQQTIENQKTRLYHAEQARDEAVAALKDMRDQALKPRPVPAERMTASSLEDEPVRTRQPRTYVKRAKREKEPQPVKWWIKG
ncbi:Hypothetical protein GbCGDNIH9_1894 [Granulibacter bethesdensis]|uniref:Uncharacterized protein n=1 Tax=Granulibacter bethesdensis TaxID=364410 RepID=A0AAC9K8F9_9PROT|nr:hypothetical protein [Granulibacter bethesdensis]APH55210.1 Hypothetical protein GbCGDNIH9_1894 [Granulibacter bethesdensis]APH62797.1 Hypothetical protein GbCGDNIH8_1894 [Granulibacter bethesdensis]